MTESSNKGESGKYQAKNHANTLWGVHVKYFTKVKSIIKKNRVLNFITASAMGAVFRFFRYKNRSSINNKTIAIILLQRLGDSVFSIPAIKAIFNHYKGYSVYIINYSGTKELFEPYFPSESVIELPKDYIKSNLIVKSEARKILNDLNPEIVFDLNTTIMGASFLYNCKASRIVGANELFYKNLYDNFAFPRVKPQLKDIYLDVVKQEISLDDKDIIPVFGYRESESDRILIQPFAGWEEKEWEFMNFHQLTERLIHKGFNAVMVFEKGRVNKDMLSKISVPFYETESVGALIEEIRDSYLFVSNDSGPLYIAASRGKATYAIYGPTNPKYTFPSEGHHTYIRKEIECVPNTTSICVKNGGQTCPFNECLKNLSVDEVFLSLTDFIAALPRKKKFVSSKAE